MEVCGEETGPTCCGPGPGLWLPAWAGCTLKWGLKTFHSFSSDRSSQRPDLYQNFHTSVERAFFFTRAEWGAACPRRWAWLCRHWAPGCPSNSPCCPREEECTPSEAGSTLRPEGPALWAVGFLVRTGFRWLSVEGRASVWQRQEVLR